MNHEGSGSYFIAPMQACMPTMMATGMRYIPCVCLCMRRRTGEQRTLAHEKKKEKEEECEEGEEKGKEEEEECEEEEARGRIGKTQ